jgi:hypothetical protein
MHRHKQDGDRINLFCFQTEESRLKAKKEEKNRTEMPPWTRFKPNAKYTNASRYSYIPGKTKFPLAGVSETGAVSQKFLS